MHHAIEWGRGARVEDRRRNRQRDLVSHLTTAQRAGQVLVDPDNGHRLPPDHSRTQYNIHMPSQQDRFWSKVEKTDTCWLWTACMQRGYGIFARISGAGTRAHRIAYYWTYGTAPEQLDHLCHQSDGSCQGGSTCTHRRCVNPGHLAPTTIRANVLRGIGPTAQNRRKTHCQRGHPLIPDNVYMKKHGRECRP